MKKIRLLASFLLISAVLLSFGGCLSMKIDKPGLATTLPQQDSPLSTADTATYSEASSDPAVSDTVQSTQAGESQSPATQAPETSRGIPVTDAPSTQSATQAPVSVDNPASWSKDKIVDTLGTAINKSKAYKGELDVDHSESFVAEVTSITGGQVFAGIASKLIGLVTKPTNETLHYSNGTTTNSEGEVVPILLPKRNEFCLTPDGVAEATAVRNDNGTLIKIKLVREVADILEIPKYQSQSMGYLDVSSLNVLSMFDTYDVTFTYPASTITAQINEDGYVSSATYYIPLHFEGSGSKGLLKGEGVFDGSQTEVWTLRW